jgi:hypothetical protein
MDSARQFIDTLGGYRMVAHRLGKPETTVHSWITTNLPPYSYLALCELAVEAGVALPAPGLFRFLALPPAERVAA